MSSFVLAFAVALSGCGSVDVFTVARLAAISPLEADPAGSAVTADLPEGLRLRPDGLVLELEAQRADLGEAVGARYVLVAQQEGGRKVWRVNPDDLSELRMLQAKIREWESSAPDATEGHLGVYVAGCAVGAGPDPEGTISVFLRTSAEDPLRPLIRNAPMKDVISFVGEVVIPPCDVLAQR